MAFRPTRPVVSCAATSASLPPSSVSFFLTNPPAALGSSLMVALRLRRPTRICQCWSTPAWYRRSKYSQSKYSAGLLPSECLQAIRRHSKATKAGGCPEPAGESSGGEPLELWVTALAAVSKRPLWSLLSHRGAAGAELSCYLGPVAGRAELIHEGLQLLLLVLRPAA